jgi:hypothetical protein
MSAAVASTPTKLDEGNFAEIKSPAVLEGGAIRPGGLPNIYAWKHIGLLAQYAALGVIHGTISNSVYAFLYQYLRMTGVQVASARALLQVIWFCKFFVGIVSDCYPIFGYHRRPYMILGWLVVFGSLFAMALVSLPEPYYPDSDWAKLKKFTDVQKAELNTNAPDQGVKYLVLMVITNIGLLIANTASDGILVDFAQREPEEIRGSVQAMTNAIKFLFAIISACMVGFGMNGPEYGGSFSESLGFNAIMGICSAFALAVIPFTWYCIQEEKVMHRNSLRAVIASVYDILQMRVVYQIVAFRFLRNVFALFSTTAASPVQSLWAGVEPLNDAIASVLTYIMASAGFYLTKRYGLNWSWRTMIVVTQFAVIIIDCIPTMLTIWDVVRSQWFWLGIPLVEELPYYAGMAVSSFAIIEVIEEGQEAAVFGLISQLQNLASPFATVIYKNIDSHFDVASTDLVKDTTQVRSDVMYTYLIAYGFNIFSTVFVLLLPRQKAETQELKRSGGRSKIMGIFTICYLTFAFLWAVMTNCMSFSSSTSCLRIAGGSGC